MHLHGFYFEVDSLGDGMRDQPIAPPDRHPVVTQLLPSGATMAMTWTPERAGNWLFHCHIMHHVSPERRLSQLAEPADARCTCGSRRLGGMAGMILGVTVRRPGGSAAPASRRPSRGAAQADAGDGSASATRHEPAFGFALSGDGSPPRSDPRLRARARRSCCGADEPVEITVVNHLRRAHRDPLARHGARQLLRRRARLERHRPARWRR